MNIEEFVLSRRKEVSDFHRHPNGGGWVENTAMADETVVVEEGAAICDNARVKGNTSVCNNAMVCGNALVDESAHIGGEAKVSGNAEVFGNARVFGDAHVYESAKVFQDARIRGDTWLKGNVTVRKYTYLYGSEWHKSPRCHEIKGSSSICHIHENQCVTNSKEGHSAISYLSRSHEFWMSKEGEKLLKGWEFTDSEISECRKYVRTIMESEKKDRKIVQIEKPRHLLRVAQKITQKVGIRMG